MKRNKKHNNLKAKKARGKGQKKSAYARKQQIGSKNAQWYFKKETEENN